MKSFFIWMLFLVIIASEITSCTPAIVVGALAGGAYVGYTLGREGYTIHITKPVKGKKVIVDNSTKTKK